MVMQQDSIHRFCAAAFWLGLAAIVCGIVSLAAFNATLFQIYLAMTAATIALLTGLRWYAGRALQSTTAIVTVAATLGFLALSILFFVPLCSLTNMAELRTQSARSLKQIAFALSRYQDKHGFLPAAAITSPDGKPLLSWRVAILPFLGKEELYRQFNLDETWDSPWNRGLLKRMPAVYHTPLQPGETALPYTTFYQIFVGPGTVFEPGAKLQIPRDVPDGTDQTILVVEAGVPVPWTQPNDLVFDPKGPIPALGVFRRHKGRFPWRGGEGTGGVMVAVCDGHVRAISWPGISEQTLRSAIVRNDGLTLGNDW